MKKKSMICSVVAMALILTGTGYAYWTDSLKVTTKATTGDMDVNFVDLGLYAQYTADLNGSNYANEWSIVDGIGNTGYAVADFFMRGSDFDSVAKGGIKGANETYKARAKGYNQVNFDAEYAEEGKSVLKDTIRDYTAGTTAAKEIKLTVNNMYPGFAQAFRSDIANTGSIAVKLSKLQFTVTDSSNGVTEDMLGVAVLVEREHQVSGVDGEPVFKLANIVDKADIFTLGGVDFVRLSALKDLSADTLDKYKELLALPSGNTMDFFIAIGMDPDAEGVYTTGSTTVMASNDDTESQGTGASLTIDLLWDQFNEGKDVKSSNILIRQNH